MNRRNAFLLIPIIAVALLDFACAAHRQAAVKNPPYAGPTQTMAEVVAEINANNAAVPTIWARHSFEINIVEPNGHTTFANGDGTLLYKSPAGLRFVGNKPVNLN